GSSSLRPRSRRSGGSGSKRTPTADSRRIGQWIVRLGAQRVRSGLRRWGGAVTRARRGAEKGGAGVRLDRAGRGPSVPPPRDPGGGTTRARRPGPLVGGDRRPRGCQG